jgi:hypothetical protein
MLIECLFFSDRSAMMEGTGTLESQLEATKVQYFTGY